jgi:hypothetical protein
LGVEATKVLGGQSCNDQPTDTKTPNNPLGQVWWETSKTSLLFLGIAIWRKTPVGYYYG